MAKQKPASKPSSSKSVQALVATYREQKKTKPPPKRSGNKMAKEYTQSDETPF
jgi:hypothetical protein